MIEENSGTIHVFKKLPDILFKSPVNCLVNHTFKKYVFENYFVSHLRLFSYDAMTWKEWPQRHCPHPLLFLQSTLKTVLRLSFWQWRTLTKLYTPDKLWAHLHEGIHARDQVCYTRMRAQWSAEYPAHSVEEYQILFKNILWKHQPCKSTHHT